MKKGVKMDAANGYVWKKYFWEGEFKTLFSACSAICS